MKIIALIGVIGIVLFDLAGGLPQSSVGGPLTLFLIFFIAMLAVGIHDAWSHKRGVLGWILSIICSVIGGFLAVAASGMAMEAIIPLLKLDGSLAASRHPMRYVSSAVMMMLTLLGSWIALQIVNRLR